MIRKLAHLCLVTDQMQTLVDFYTKKIGLNVQFDFKNADGQLFGFYLGCGDTTFIEIFDRVLMHKQWGGQPQPAVAGNRITHFCLEVTGLREFVAELATRGVEVTPISTGMDHSIQAWTKDPDGNALELMEYTAASWQLRGNAHESSGN